MCSSDLTAEAMQLFVAAARLDDGRVAWRDRLVEADELRRAFDALDRLGVAVTDPRDVELRVAVLRELNRPDELLVAIDRALAAQWLGAEAQSRLLAIAAQVYIDRSALVEAANYLRRLDANGVGNDAVLELWTRLCQRHLSTGEAKTAVTIASDVLARTPADAPGWADRFLLATEARLVAEPATKAELLTELRARAQRFGDGVATVEQRARYRDLLTRCGGRP